MIRIDQRSRVPIYEQIQQSVEELILTGIYTADDQLPSVRTLAADLAINPNTIQKAYHLMERQGLIYSLPGRGSFIALSADDLRSKRTPDVFANLDIVLNDLWQLRISENDVIVHVQESHAAFCNVAQKGGEPHDPAQ